MWQRGFINLVFDQRPALSRMTDSLIDQGAGVSVAAGSALKNALLASELY